MSEHYDRQGKPMTMMDWAQSLKSDRRVAETTLPNGYWISTVWLGLNHQFGSGPPLIFETMVFQSRDDLDEMDCDRYSTEAEALKGHEEMVAKWSRDPEHR
jgi:hypothetical protein